MVVFKIYEGYANSKMKRINLKSWQRKAQRMFGTSPPDGFFYWQGDKRARKLANKGFWLLSLEIDLAILGKKLTKELGIGASLLGIIINKWEMVRRTFSS